MTKTKKMPAWVKNRLLIWILQSKFGVLFSHWLTQCLLYAELTEVLFRLSLELTIFFLIGALWWSFAGASFCNILCIVLLTHTITFFINGQFFVTARFLGIVHNEPKAFIEYPQSLRRSFRNKMSIDAMVMFGSLSRERFSPSSDLDVRIVAKDGFINNFMACFWVFLQRFRALLNKYPLDIYVVTKRKGLEKLRTDEPPIILFDKEGFIPMQYDEYYQYDTFKEIFLKKYHCRA